jgi:phage-related baseplate assembly protein
MAISGVPSSTTMEAVRRTIFAENVKLATDVISLRSAVAVPYEINAKVFVQPGPDPSLIRQQAIASVSAAAGRYRRLAGGVPASALISALQVAGVDGATLLSPPGGVRTERWQFGDLTKIDVEVACLNDRGVTQWQ